jgi:hypothetical protein
MANAQRRGGIGTIPQDQSSNRWATSGPVDVVGYEKLTVSTVAVGFASIPATADSVMLRVETNPIRWRGDGTNPDATTGCPMLVADPDLSLLNIGIDGLFKFKFIRSGGADGVLSVVYLRVRG